MVRFGDVGGHLHGARGQADLVADHLAAAGDLLVDPGALDGVGIGDGHVRVLQGELADLLAGALGDVEAFGGLLDQLGVKHGNLRNSQFLLNSGCRLLCLPS
ncbi:hypothetical protein D3C81_1902120 [compost metagenome]